ncbi:MAG: hypothetical protein K8T90_04720 [Planctomycetes bacterium]|nr:hypothetical protein [Planctomycetota bacterium]
MQHAEGGDGAPAREADPAALDAVRSIVRFGKFEAIAGAILVIASAAAIWMGGERTLWTALLALVVVAIWTRWALSWNEGVRAAALELERGAGVEAVRAACRALDIARTRQMMRVTLGGFGVIAAVVWGFFRFLGDVSEHEALGRALAQFTTAGEVAAVVTFDWLVLWALMRRWGPVLERSPGGHGE